MRCPRCGSKVNVVVEVVMTMPSEFEEGLSKATIRKRDVKLRYVNCSETRYYCTSTKCIWNYKPNKK